MKTSVSYLTQSKYYSPAFNAAIFDGPIRIYFAQYQESQALKIYFRMQERLKEYFRESKLSTKKYSPNVFIMLYPTDDSFYLSFDQANGQRILLENLGEDYVIGIQGPLEDQDCEPIYEMAETILKGWETTPRPLVEGPSL